MIGPSADSIKPGFKHPEFAVAKFRYEVFQQEHGKDFFFEGVSAEKFVRNLEQEVQVMLIKNL